MTKSEVFFDEKIREIAQERVVYDIGGCQRFQKGMALYKNLFVNCHYTTVDINLQCQPDILADAQNLPIADGTADAVIIKSVLEYTENPQKVVAEMLRILKPGGKCLCCITFLHPYHGSKTGRDYWRFSSDGARYLFRKFSHLEICPLRGYFETMANFLPKQDKFPINLSFYLARALDRVSGKYQNPKQSSGFNLFLIK